MMKHTNLISFAAGTAVCAALGLGLGLGFTQPEKVKDKAKSKVAGHAQPEQPGLPDMDAMMAEMTQKATPGEHHKALDKMVGDWTVHTEFVMPGQEPMIGTGTMQTEWALGGRFTISNLKIPEFMGSSFEGMAITGYDNYANEYTGVWVDTMTTRVTTTHGNMTEDGTLVMEGTSVTPMGETGMRIETTTTANTVIDKFYDQMPDGSWVQSGTITYTRSN
ncbi:MAG: hypothetical protein ACI89L_001922 [Phycisphaerales bacterium]|jgi:hypothetical protein